MDMLVYWLFYGFLWRVVWDFPWIVAAGLILWFFRDRVPNPVRIWRRRQRIGWLEARVVVNPENAEDRCELGELLLDDGRPAAAALHLAEAARKAPESAGIHFLLGLAHLRAGEPDRAVPSLETATRLDRGFRYGEALLRLGEALAAAGRLREATAAFEAHVSINASSAEGLYRLAAVRLAAADAAGARRAVEELAATVRLAPRFRRRLDQPWLRRAGRLPIPAGAAPA
jgi:tetratricopeptide (TPR) repeat protein